MEVQLECSHEGEGELMHSSFGPYDTALRTAD